MSEALISPEDSATCAPVRILLVNPTVVGKPEHLHIGLGTLASYIAQHSDHVVEVADFAAIRRGWKAILRKRIKQFRPDVVGMHITTPYFPSAKVVADEIKAIDSSIFILGGGHHCTFSPDEVIAHPTMDGVVVGEGEKPIVLFLDAFSTKSCLGEVPGLWWKEDGEVKSSDKTSLLDPADIPSIDWSLHDEETLRRVFYLWGVLPVMASRGCPSKCSFCAISTMQELYHGEKFLRFRDPIEVVDEIEGQYEKFREYGLRIVFFYDLNFLMRPKWLKTFTDEYKRRGLNKKLKWSAYTRADHITQRVLDALKDSGCVNLRIGIESANPEMRNDIYNKELPQNTLENAVAAIKEIGIAVTGYFIAGGPGERPEWLIESLEFAYKHGVEFPAFFQYKPLAGTSVLDIADELGSHVIMDSLGESADFLNGVNMTHRHIDPWQLKAFLTLTHILFGGRLISAQFKREGPRYLTRLARYLAMTTRLGFTPYMAFSYYTFYAGDHLNNPVLQPAAERRGLRWRASMAVTRTWLRDWKSYGAGQA